MLAILVSLFFAAFFINLLYEMLHSLLYKTCRQVSLEKYVYLIIKGAIFDGLSIAAIYFFTFLIFQNRNIFENYLQLILFCAISLFFAYIWEVYSLRAGKWEYEKNMPLILGVGLTPLIQLAATGILSIYLGEVGIFELTIK